MTSTAFRLAATLALLSASQLQAAAPARPCMTPAELRGMVAYVLPSATTMVIDRCRPVLPAGASLLTHGTQLARTFESGRSANFALARQAFTKFAGTDDKNATAIMLTMPEVTLRPIVDEIVTKELTKSIKVKDCPNIDRIFATLEPLPASNFIELITQAMIVTAGDNKQMSMCAA